MGWQYIQFIERAQITSHASCQVRQTAQNVHQTVLSYTGMVPEPHHMRQLRALLWAISRHYLTREPFSVPRCGEVDALRLWRGLHRVPMALAGMLRVLVRMWWRVLMRNRCAPTPARSPVLVPLSRLALALTPPRYPHGLYGLWRRSPRRRAMQLLRPDRPKPETERRNRRSPQSLRWAGYTAGPQGHPSGNSAFVCCVSSDRPRREIGRPRTLSSEVGGPVIIPWPLAHKRWQFYANWEYISRKKKCKPWRRRSERNER